MKNDIDKRLLLLAEEDNVLMIRSTLSAGDTVSFEDQVVTVDRRIDLGHKLARRPIPSGTKVVKYGVSIGTATEDIEVGSHVHTHNLRSDYTQTHTLTKTVSVEPT